jgi:hypothetical protein
MMSSPDSMWKSEKVKQRQSASVKIKWKIILQIKMMWAKNVQEKAFEMLAACSKSKVLHQSNIEQQMK